MNGPNFYRKLLAHTIVNVLGTKGPRQTEVKYIMMFYTHTHEDLFANLA